MNIKRFSMIKKGLCMVAFAMFMSSPAFAGPTIDGRFVPSEGYTTGFYVNFTVDGGKDNPDIPVDEQGQIWFYQDSITYDLSVAFIQPLSLIDNSYGANQVGWGDNAPSGKDHELHNLANSDDADFFFDIGGGISFTIDYAANNVSNSEDLFQATVTSGDPSNVIEVASSLEYNWQQYGTTDSNDDFYYLFNATYDSGKEEWKAGNDATSPLTGSDTTYGGVDPLLENWEFEVIYEFEVNLNSIFDPESLNITLVHDSPNKIGKNEVYPQEIYTDIAQPVPEPATMLLLGSGLVGIWVFRRKFRRG